MDTSHRISQHKVISLAEPLGNPVLQTPGNFALTAFVSAIARELKYSNRPDSHRSIHGPYPTATGCADTN